MKNAIKVLTSEKIFNTLNKYKLHTESIYFKAVDFAGNVFEIDLLRLINL